MKEALRNNYKQKRKALTEAALKKISGDIFWQLRDELGHLLTGKIHVFLPIQKQKEIDTWPIIHWLWEQDAEVVVSKSKLNTPDLEHFRLVHDTLLELNPWGIPEPINAMPVDQSTLTAVLIPLLCFDRHGHRIGYGKGYYDRFLSTCPNNPLKIGLSHFEPIEGYIEALESDILLDYCVTPSATYKFEA